MKFETPSLNHNLQFPTLCISQGVGTLVNFIVLGTSIFIIPPLAHVSDSVLLITYLIILLVLVSMVSHNIIEEILERRLIN